VRTRALETWSRETVHLSSDRLIAIAVAVVIWAASAGESEASPPPPPSEPDAQADVGELFRSGQDRFETSDFKGAIEQWTRAYEGLPDGPEHQAIRAMLLANLAQAHVEAYAIDEDPEHLRRADGLFVSYLAMIDVADTQTHETIEAERRRIAGLLEQAEAEQREADRATRSEPDARATDPDRAGKERPDTVSSLEADGRPPIDRTDAVEPFNKGERALLIGGGVTLTLGVGLTGAAGAFLWLRNEEEKQGAAASRDIETRVAVLRDHGRNAIRFNRLAITTGAASGVLIGLGLGLIGTADVHRRRRPSDRTTVGVGLDGTVVVRGRF
jgi:hypothetical protein